MHQHVLHRMKHDEAAWETQTFVYICVDGTRTDLLLSTSHNFYANQIFHLVSLQLSHFPYVSEAKYKMPQCYKANEMNYAWPEIWVHWHLYITPGIIYRATTPGKERWKGDQGWTCEGFKGISQLKSTPSSSAVRTVIVSTSRAPRLSACPTAQLLRSSPNSLVVCAMIWHSNSTQSKTFAAQQFDELFTGARFKQFICREIPLVIADW